MAGYCSVCGTPASGPFCGQCGNAIPGSVFSQPTAHPSAQPGTPMPPKASRGAAKILLFVAGAVLLLGAVGIGSTIYIVHRAKQKLGQLNRRDLPTRASESGRSVAAMKRPDGNGCPVLSWEEASEVLGIAWERVSYSPGAGNGGVCEFTTTPAERLHMGERQFTEGLSSLSGAKNNQDQQKDVMGALAGFVNTLGNLKVPKDDKDANDGIHIEFVRKGGPQAWTRLDQLQTGVKVLSGNRIGMTAIQGLGDRAYVLPAGIGVMVLSGDAFFSMTFFAWPGQDQAVALARRVAGHL